MAGDGGAAALSEHAHGAWRRRARRRRPGLAVAAVGGAAGSVPHVEDSSSPRETEVPRGMRATWGMVGDGGTPERVAARDGGGRCGLGQSDSRTAL